MRIEGSTVAVTGAAGFIGARIVALFTKRGARVRGLDLSERSAGVIRAAGGEPIVGDVTNEADARRLCAGAQIVIHTAAVVGEGGDRALYDRINVGGTRTIAGASRGARFVQLSSVMVYGFTYPRDVTEAGPFRGEGNAYCETKLESERVVMEMHRRGELEAIAIRPGDVYGPGSQPWIVRPLEMMKKGLFTIPRGGVINATYVDDLVEGIALAIEKDAIGEAFNVTGDVAVPCEEFFGRVARMIGKKKVATAPTWVLRPLFGAIEKVSLALGKEPIARASAVDFLLRPWRVSNGKAKRVLGWAPQVDLDEGMRRTEAWVKTQSWS